MGLSKIPKASKEQITEWARTIIKNDKIIEQTLLGNIAYAVADFFGKQMPEYKILVFDADLTIDCFYVKKAEPIKKDPDEMLFDDLFLIKPKEPMTEEGSKIAQITMKTFDEILKTLERIHPSQYPKILQELGLKEFTKIPEIRLDSLNFWATKIIDYFKLTPQTSLEKIIKQAITFFNVLFPEYSAEYVLFKNKEKLPIYIKRKYGNDFAYLLEMDQIRNCFYLTYYFILQKLNRMKDRPKDPEYWFSFVTVYEDLGMPEKANEVGDIGLSLNPQELGGLTEIITYYSEKRQLIKGLKYIKKAGLIFLDQKQFKVAVQTWENITRFEPNVKQNWINLARAYRGFGDETKAKQAELRANSAK